MENNRQIVFDLQVKDEKLLISLDLRKIKRVIQDINLNLDKISPRPIRENQLFKCLNTFLEENIKEAEVYQKAKYNVLKGIGNGRKKAALYFSRSDKNSLRLMVHKDIIEKQLTTIYFYERSKKNTWQEKRVYIHDPIQFNESLNSYIAEKTLAKKTKYGDFPLEVYCSQAYIHCFDIPFYAKEDVNEILLIPDIFQSLEDILTDFRKQGDPDGMGQVDVLSLKCWFEFNSEVIFHFIDYSEFLSKPIAGSLNTQAEKQYDGTYTLIFSEQDIDILKEFLNIIKNDLIGFTKEY